MASYELYASIDEVWSTVLSNSIGNVVSGSLAQNIIFFESLLTFYIVISGIITMFGQMSLHQWVFGAARAGLIGFLLGASAFNQYIQTPIMHTIPDWISQTAAGSLGAKISPNQFDNLRNTVAQMHASFLRQANGMWDFGERARGWFVFLVICFEISISFIAWEANKAYMGFLVAIAPYIGGFYLFRNLRYIVQNWIGMVISGFIYYLFISVLLNISINANERWLALSRADSASLDVQLDNMTGVAIWFFFFMCMTAIIPFMASRMGGGFVFSIADKAAEGAMGLPGRTASVFRNRRRR